MSRGRKKSRKVINPLVEHIADYSDIANPASRIAAQRFESFTLRFSDDSVNLFTFVRHVRESPAR